MTFQDVRDDLNELGGKVSGQLIRAEGDWNALVGLVVDMGEVLNKTIADLKVDHEALKADHDDLKGKHDALQVTHDALEIYVGQVGSTDTSNLTGKVAALEGMPEDLQPLLENRRVTMQTRSMDRLIGEVAEITATVTELDGTPVTDRPWVDFVCTWGSVVASSGFTVRSGSSGQAVSVRTDSTGIARVQVRAQQAVHLGDTDETYLNAFFQTDLPDSGDTIQRIIFQSSSTNGPTMRNAFREMGRAYKGKSSFRSLADNYYLDNRLGYTWDRWRGGNWKDYRSTVLAFVKRDSNPTTADFSLGTSSIQVTFRDWIGPWSVDHGIIEVEQFEDKFKDIFDPAIAEVEIIRAFDDIKSGVDDILKDSHIIERGIYLDAAEQAIDAVDTTGLSGQVNEMIQQVKFALQTQKAGDLAQFAGQTAGVSQAGQSMFTAAMDQAKGITNTNQAFTRSMDGLNLALETLDGEVGGRVGAVETGMQDVSGLVSGLSDKFVVLNSRVDTSEVAGNTILSSLTNIGDQVRGINELDAAGVTERLSVIHAKINLIKSNIVNQ